MAINQFVELQKEMEEFQDRLRLALEDRKLNLMKMVDEYRQDIDRLELRQQESKRRLMHLKSEEKAVKDEIESSERQKDENAAKMEVYRLRKQKLESEKVNLTTDSKELQQLLAQKQDEIHHKRQLLQRQQLRDLAEVQTYSQILGLTIEAPKPEVLQFVFHRVSESDPTLTCEICLDLSQELYRLSGTQPGLTKDALQDLELHLNNTGDLAQFLKASRTALIDALPSRAT
ncbi:LANO_0G01948g1_1 [Lachancea nothofagi CBS 11611]|uniref:Kinetochore protein SPC25 n=1 Tax=Lachancea nothofagi CBS 11611 TaxID=1266666 RepID=A0A1G4KFG2_9SACH|nr:LANO_0G01948g1_1 [Lachancea nothofagi CBS 11611]